MAPAVEHRRFGDREVRLTNLAKVLFPGAGLTKGDIVDHVVAVAPVLLPGLADRPLSMERFIHGLGGRGFFHKHKPDHFPDWVRTTTTETSRGPMVQVVVDDLATLVLVTNFGCLTPHVPCTTISHPGHPDQLVVDLDPPEGADIGAIRGAGHIVREALEDAGLRAHARWSGSRGLHVVVPLDGAASARDVMRFSGAMATALVDRHPDLVTREFKKVDRAGRIYLDLGRNAPGATIVASWGLRCRPGAPLAMPVTWEEVDRTGPQSFAVRDAAARLAMDPWPDFRARRCRLPGG